MRRLFVFLIALSLFACSDDGSNEASPDTGTSESDMGGQSDTGSTSDMTTGPDGGTSPMCVDRAEVPIYGVRTSNCGGVESCGEPVDGTWEVVSSCLAPRDVTEQLFAVCNTAEIQRVLSSNVSGEVTISGDSIDATFGSQFQAQVRLPNNCTGCRCEDAGEALRSAGISANCNPVCAGGDCFCEISASHTDEVSETFTFADGELTTESGRTFSFCAAEAFADIRETTSDAVGATYGLAAGDVPEICNGEDDDGDGVVDNDPVECSSCLNQGVCADGLDASCEEGRWSCEYTSANYEMDETSCDGLDNDCDGLIDESETCEICDGIDNDNNGSIDDNLVDTPPDCSMVGVCAEGGTPVCSGTLGWTCDFTSGRYSEVESDCDNLDNDCDGATDVHCCSRGDSAFYFAWLGLERPRVYNIAKSNLDGTGYEVLHSSQDTLQNVDYDPTNNLVYWSNGTTNRFETYDVETGEIDQVGGFSTFVSSLDVSPDGTRLLYVLGGGDQRGIYWFDISDPQTVTRVELNERGPSDAWVDWRDGWIYFSQPNLRGFSRIRFDSTGFTRLNEEDYTNAVVVDHSQGLIFYSNGTRIKKMPIGGGSAEMVAELNSSGTMSDFELDAREGWLYMNATTSQQEPARAGRMRTDDYSIELFDFPSEIHSMNGVGVRSCGF